MNNGRISELCARHLSNIEVYSTEYRGVNIWIRRFGRIGSQCNAIVWVEAYAYDFTIFGGGPYETTVTGALWNVQNRINKVIDKANRNKISVRWPELPRALNKQDVGDVITMD